MGLATAGQESSFHSQFREPVPVVLPGMAALGGAADRRRQ